MHLWHTGVNFSQKTGRTSLVPLQAIRDTCWPTKCFVQHGYNIAYEVQHGKYMKNGVNMIKID